MTPCGRFAPSPTGPLHFGSLVAAMASYADARSRRGRWVLRIENLDRPREVAGAAGGILRTLEAFGFQWDGEVLYQSRRHDAYRDALERLRAGGWAYQHDRSRQGKAYTGASVRSWRFRVPSGAVVFHDRWLGSQSWALAAESDDFALFRADGIFSYQLAVVVDDAFQQVTDVVRGADLLDSTPRQILLQRALGLPQPAYLHVPVAVNERGEKLSKQTLAPALDSARPVVELHASWRFLGQPPVEAGSVGEFWRAALPVWSVPPSPPPSPGTRLAV